MLSFFSVILVLLSAFYNGCDGRACTCRVTNQQLCEKAGKKFTYTSKIKKYNQLNDNTMDGEEDDEPVISQCSWDTEHNKCRNTLWLQCKNDENCVWVRKDYNLKIEQREDGYHPDLCDVSQQSNGEEDMENMQYEYEPHDADEDIVDEEEEEQEEVDEDVMAVHSSMRLESGTNHIRIFALSAVALIVILTGIYRLFKGDRPKDIHSALQCDDDHKYYSTF